MKRDVDWRFGIFLLQLSYDIIDFCDGYNRLLFPSKGSEVSISSQDSVVAIVAITHSYDRNRREQVEILPSPQVKIGGENWK